MAEISARLNDLKDAEVVILLYLCLMNLYKSLKNETKQNKNTPDPMVDNGRHW